VPHVKSLRQRMNQAADMLGIIHGQFDSMETVFKQMSQLQINTEQLNRYLKLVFPDPQDVDSRSALAAAQNNRLWSTYFFEQGKGTDLPGVKGTLWAAYNAVAELIDHRLPQSPGGRSSAG